MTSVSTVENANRKGFKVKVKVQSNIGAYIFSSIYFPEQKSRSKASFGLPITSGNASLNIGVNEFLVSKETEVMRRWERSKTNIWFIKRVDKG